MTSLSYQKESLRCRLAHLMDSWGRKRQEIEKANGRMLSMGAPEDMASPLFRKFRKFLDQIAFFREKERNIISEIDAVEQKHRFMRERKLLKRADPNKAQQLPGPDEDYEAAKEENEKRRDRFWWFLILLFLVTRRWDNSYDQSPTAG